MIPGAIKKTGGEVFASIEEAINNIQSLWARKIANLNSATMGDKKEEAHAELALH